jgi:hypothetical protein
MIKRIISLSVLLMVFFIKVPSVDAQKGRHTFKLGTNEFLLDGQPFQIISAEIHPARIPAEYWRQRIQMAKALGCNTITSAIFWNFHESQEGIYDFSEGEHNLSQFCEIVKEEEMYLILRPGPYVGAEWELGGIPPYLLRIPDIKLRSMDPRFMAATEKYITKLAEVIAPFLVNKGGPVIMLQIENEYGSYGNDRNYLMRLKEVWNSNKINIPTFTADKPEEQMLKAGTAPGSVVGLNSGGSQSDFELAAKINPGVPVFSSEVYTGTYYRWGDERIVQDSSELIKTVRSFMDNKISFNLHVLQGGTNFGFTAGANSGVNGYEPSVTSYMPDALLNEQGRTTPLYTSLRTLMESYQPKGKKLPAVPLPYHTLDLSMVPLNRFTSIWDNLPQPVQSVHPKTFEEYDQESGLILYKTELTNTKQGKLIVTDIHDYATVFLDGAYIGNLDRSASINSIDLPAVTSERPVLEILVEAMGRVSSGPDMHDRKGITDSVTLDGITLINWNIYKFPMNRKFNYELRSSARVVNKPGIIFRGNFMISQAAGVVPGDTFIDFSNYSKGIVWVNGHNIGRYWNIGPQKKLFCPALWMREGLNEIIIFDFHQKEGKLILGSKTLE